MIKIVSVIACLYLLIEFLRRTEQGADGKIRFNDVPRWVGLVNGLFNPSAKSSVVEVEVQTIEDE